MSESMKITALAPWFGGKRRLAPEIILELGAHRAYWEPFCGSMAILMCKPPSALETVNDLHYDLINLARVIQDQRKGCELYRRLRRTLCSEADYIVADEICHALEEGNVPADMSDVDRAYIYFVGSWNGRNGSSGSSCAQRGTFCAKYTQSGGNAANRFHRAALSIPAWRKRMRNVQILNRDGFELLERIEDARNTAIYLDPPYFEKGAKYLHDFESEDHDRLAAAVGRFKLARVVVSYYDHPRLQELYPGWNQRKIVVAKSLGHGGQRGNSGSMATEVLLTNGPSYAAQQGLFP